MVTFTMLCVVTLVVPDDADAQAGRQQAVELVAQLATFTSDGPWWIHDEQGQDAESRAARTVMNRLAMLGKPAVPELIAALDSKNPTLTGRAALVLASMGPEAVEAIPALIQQLKYEGDYTPERMAKRALRQLGPLATPDLLTAIEHQDAHIRWQAAAVLGTIRPVANVVPAALVKLLADDDISVSSTAARMLAAIGEPAVAPLVAAMQEDSENRLFNPSGILMQIGPAARQSVPVLRSKLTAPSPVAEHARYALLAIDVEWASGEVRSNDLETRLRSSWIFSKGYWREGCTTREGEVAVAALVAALRDADARVVEHAAKALAHTGPWAQTSLPALISRLEDTAVSPEIRQASIVSLGTLRAAGHDALPTLRKASLGSDETLSRFALRAIQRIEHPDAELGSDL